MEITRTDKFLHYWYEEIDPDIWDPTKPVGDKPGKGRKPKLSDKFIETVHKYPLHKYWHNGKKRPYHNLKEASS